MHEYTVDRRKARTTHKYPINTVEGKREIIRAPLNLRYTLEKDELNLASAAGFPVAKKSNILCARAILHFAITRIWSGFDNG